MIIGGRRTPEFGPVVLVGLGGIYVEVMADVAIRLAPVSRKDAQEMISDLQGHRLLEGVRSQPSADRDAVGDILVRVSTLLAEEERILEIDLNPVKVFPQGNGAVAIDVRIIAGLLKTDAPSW